jgi:outer membrane protein assembly factor BamB
VDAETGQIEWKQHLGKPDNMYGHASSLALYGEHLILQYDQGMGGGGLSKLIARKIDSGAIAWSVDRPVGSSWATPIIIRPESGDQIVTSSDPLVTGHSAADGTELWRVDAMGADHTPSPIYVAGLVIAASGSADMVAVDPADRGEVEPKWVADEGIPDIPTPVADATHLFTVVSDGWTLCRKVADGEKLWEAELDVATEVDASPLIVNGKLCVLDVDGVMFVLDAGAEKTEPQTYQIPERCQATPAFAPGRMFIRGAKTLYCIGGKP